MNYRFSILLTLICVSQGSLAQVDLGGFVKDKSQQAQQKAKEKAREKGTESLEKQRKEYDESNFNYAICFLDNSGLFEAGEKGNAFASNMLSGSKLLNKEEKTLEERAYTNLKNGELLMAGNKFYLAEQSFKLAKFEYEQSGATQNTNYAQTLSDLGLLYQTRGRYTQAKPFHEKALEIRKTSENKNMYLVSLNNLAVWKKENGQFSAAELDLLEGQRLAKELNNTLALGLIQNNLALTYADMYKLKEAEKLMQSALSEAGKSLEPTSSNYIKLRINLAGLFRIQTKYKEAEEIYLACIAIKEKKLGAHPDLAQLKKGLAEVYMDMGKTKEVGEKLLQSALDINTRKLGAHNPATVATLHELGNFHRFTGQDKKALDEIKQVVEQYKIIYGEKHPTSLQGKEDLTQWNLNEVQSAAANYREVLEGTLAFIRDFFSTLNENEKSRYWEKTSSRLQRYFNFMDQHINSLSPDPLPEFYNTCIATKGFLINGASKIRSAILGSSDEALKRLYLDWLETKEYLNQAFQLSKEELQTERVNLDSLQQAEDKLEKQLSQKSELFAKGTESSTADLKKIQSALEPTEAVVEIVELNDYANGFNGKQHYLAFVVLPGSIKRITLGQAENIHPAIAEFRKNTLDLKASPHTYASTWKELDPTLQGVKTLYLSVDGMYHQLSFAALQREDGKYLVDLYNLIFLSNSRDLPNFKTLNSKPKKPESAFLAGNPKFGGDGLIESLPGAEKEAIAIKALLTKNKVPCQLVVGEKATEQSIKKIKPTGILHLATHGYFLSDVSEVESNKVLGVEIGAARENPLLRSGLLFANCENVFAEGYHPTQGEENGILTAFEAMSINLDKTELVVLSACETGLGDVKQGEGVYGLQRALLIAGTKSIIMSLWSVSDEATMQLMTDFYTNYLKSGNKVVAFRNAVLQLKVKYPKPFYWSPFVLLNN